MSEVVLVVLLGLLMVSIGLIIIEVTLEAVGLLEEDAGFLLEEDSGFWVEVVFCCLLVVTV